jgi:hypothetical protein
MIIFFDDWIPLLFLLCSSSKGAWFHDKSRDATPGDIKSFEVRSAFFFSLNQVHHYLQYLADDGHDAMLVSAIAIIPFHAPLDRAPVELWSVNAYCRQLAFWSHQLVQFFFFEPRSFLPISMHSAHRNIAGRRVWTRGGSVLAFGSSYWPIEPLARSPSVSAVITSFPIF